MLVDIVVEILAAIAAEAAVAGAVSVGKGVADRGALRSGMNEVQKRAVLDALFAVAGADGALSNAELERIDKTATSLFGDAGHAAVRAARYPADVAAVERALATLPESVRAAVARALIVVAFADEQLAFQTTPYEEQAQAARRALAQQLAARLGVEGAEYVRVEGEALAQLDEVVAKLQRKAA